MESAVVERLQLVDGVVGVSLRGAPERGFARYTPGVAGAGRAELCGSVWGNARLATEDGQSDIPIQELDRLGWGWHGVERDLNGDFWWSDGPVAEVLLQLTRIGAIRVELDASAAAVGLIDGPVAVTLEVNGDEMSPLEMVGAAQTYAWRVPRSSWKTGMNQVRFRVSDAVSPAAFGPSDDRRTLGLGVRRLELTLLE